MKLLVDANIFLAVILNEPQKKSIIELTQDSELISTEVLPYEIGNALSAMLRRNRLNKKQVIDCWHIFEGIPVRLVKTNMDSALTLSAVHKIYAYDAYYLECAKRLKLGMLTMDVRMLDIARDMGISLMEVV